MSEQTSRGRRAAARVVAIARGLPLVLVWLVASTAIGLGFFLTTSTDTVIASHDAELTPTLNGQVTLQPGALLPDVRVTTPGVFGADVELGRTEASSTEELIRRYAVIGSQPEGQVQRLRADIRGLLIAAALRGAVLGALVPAVWLLLGAARRRALLARLGSVRVLVAGTAVLVLAVVGLWQPWRGGPERLEDTAHWQPVSTFLGSAVTLSPTVEKDLAEVEIRSDATSRQTQRLIGSAVDTYRQSTEFYADAAERGGQLERLREPGPDEQVAVLVSDRHDNIGMDPVVRAVAEAAEASIVLDAGDDTSTGQAWEAFSLDSLATEFSDFDRYAVPGNHDSGGFVARTLEARGWTILDGKPVDGPGGLRILGVPDPRSSGLGNWRDAGKVSFSETTQQLAETACRADADGERVGVLMVHDTNNGREALARGCVDLVVGGHTHVRKGPERVVGRNGAVGYRYVNGTTGGAAFALAVGSKPRRNADFAFVTLREGKPVGVQGVTLKTDGEFEVHPYAPIEPGEK